MDWGYQNAKNSGSDGLELEFKAKYSKGYATVNYSFYTQAFRTLPESYAVPGHENCALGLSQHKIGFNGSYKLLKDLSVNPSLALIGKKYGYASVDEDDNALISEFGPYYLCNLSFTYDNLLKDGLSISLSVFDILNQKVPFIQPYDGWFHPYPGSSREFLLRITLHSSLLKKQ